jgi:hypothetical protein
MKAEALLFIIRRVIETRRLPRMVISQHAIFTRLLKNARGRNFAETRRKSSSRSMLRIDDLDLVHVSLPKFQANFLFDEFFSNLVTLGLD